jgi:hypothetical protein
MTCLLDSRNRYFHSTALSSETLDRPSSPVRYRRKRESHPILALDIVPEESAAPQKGRDLGFPTSQSCHPRRGARSEFQFYFVVNNLL